jgi:preprotein translocase subunit SecG
MSEHDKDDGSYGNLFKIIDGIVSQLDRTKKIFLTILLAITIIPPVALVVTVILDTSKSAAQGGASNDWDLRLEDIPGFLFNFNNTPLVISVIGVAIALWQWTILSKWTKRYKHYKERRDKIDRKFDEDIAGSDKPNG